MGAQNYENLSLKKLNFVKICKSTENITKSAKFCLLLF